MDLDSNQLLVEVANLSKSFGDQRVLNDISFKISQHSIHGLLGPNGAGKSTIMKILAGLLNYDQGKLQLDGKELKDSQRNGLIGILADKSPLYMDMTVDDYLDFCGKINDLSKTDLIFFKEKVIDQCGLTHLLHKYIGNLSTGQKQKVSIAQVLLKKSKLIILDEPMSGLDMDGIDDLRALMKEIAIDRTVLFSTHQMSEIELICQELTIINQGKIVATGLYDDIYKHFLSKNVFVIDLAFVAPDFDFAGEMRTHFPVELVSQGVYSYHSSMICQRFEFGLIGPTLIEDLLPSVLKHLASISIYPVAIFPKQEKLEDIFKRALGRN